MNRRLLMRLSVMALLLLAHAARAAAPATGPAAARAASVERVLKEYRECRSMKDFLRIEGDFCELTGYHPSMLREAHAFTPEHLQASLQVIDALLLQRPELHGSARWAPVAAALVTLMESENAEVRRQATLIAWRHETMQFDDEDRVRLLHSRWPETQRWALSSPLGLAALPLVDSPDETLRTAVVRSLYGSRGARTNIQQHSEKVLALLDSPHPDVAKATARFIHDTRAIWHTIGVARARRVAELLDNGRPRNGAIYTDRQPIAWPPAPVPPPAPAVSVDHAGIWIWRFTLLVAGAAVLLLLIGTIRVTMAPSKQEHQAV